MFRFDDEGAYSAEDGDAKNSTTTPFQSLAERSAAVLNEERHTKLHLKLTQHLWGRRGCLA